MHALNLSELYITLAAAFPSVRFPILLSVLLSHDSSITSLADNLRATPLFLVGTALASFGALLRLACYRHLGQYFTFELSIKKEHKLITDGPYAFVRHPSYLGSISCFSGVLLCQFSAGSWWSEGSLWSTAFGKLVGIWWTVYVVFLLASMVFIRVPKEDQIMKQEFGKQWEDWSKKTPYRLFPGIY